MFLMFLYTIVWININNIAMFKIISSTNRIKYIFNIGKKNRNRRIIIYEEYIRQNIL